MSNTEEAGKRSEETPTPSTASAASQAVTDAILRAVVDIARLSEASALFVAWDALVEHPDALPQNLDIDVFYVVRSGPLPDRTIHPKARFLEVPNVALSRLGQIKIAVFLALSRGWITFGQTIVFLSGVASTGTLDTLIVTQVGREMEIFSSAAVHTSLPPDVRGEVVERVLQIAIQLGAEGREGKPTGALFVIGDTERVQAMTQQLILNPFQGYRPEDRNVLDERLTETIKEFSALDGAFVLRGDGTIETCGAYLVTRGQERFELPRGLGTRHHAAAGITAAAQCLAVTVSESTGTVTVFRDGQIITEIERQRPLSSPRRPGVQPA